VTHWEEGKAEKLVPDVFAAHMEVGIDIRKQMMEITPSMHHVMGGIAINEWGQTSIDGLYAVGEVTTNVHGANRLGGNSLAEGQVFGRRAGIHSAEESREKQPSQISQYAIDAEVARLEALLKQKNGVTAADLLRKVRSSMWNDVGIIRDAEKLQLAQKTIKHLQDEAHSLQARDRQELQPCLEVQEMLKTAEVIILSALERKESRGAHYRSDYARMDSAWEKNIRVHRDKEGKLVTRVTQTVKE
jgi:succinate dehydrogenase/fumarate reductase flavoprotein subunit